MCILIPFGRDDPAIKNFRDWPVRRIRTFLLNLEEHIDASDSAGRTGCR